VPYFYADDAYYLWDDEVQQYQEVAPPPGLNQPASQSSGAATLSSELYAYPNSGQSAEQQARDRGECQRWASEQSGFKAAQANGAITEQALVQHQDYLRAEGACLKSRNYTVN